MGDFRGEVVPGPVQVGGTDGGDAKAVLFSVKPAGLTALVVERFVTFMDLREPHLLGQRSEECGMLVMSPKRPPSSSRLSHEASLSPALI